MKPPLLCGTLGVAAACNSTSCSEYSSSCESIGKNVRRSHSCVHGDSQSQMLIVTDAQLIIHQRLEVVTLVGTDNRPKQPLQLEVHMNYENTSQPGGFYTYLVQKGDFGTLTNKALSMHHTWESVFFFPYNTTPTPAAS